MGTDGSWNTEFPYTVVKGHYIQIIHEYSSTAFPVIVSTDH